ncbi:hypothetical protein CHARACLAT_020496 [Characodon lateralis]|uniref:Uncharacterized protein n=1 Tax=Characodon lateralis TaxID=208331 RepID=A0ABU7EVX0_9TELE|nr:hypothetical protein [Characodon lateralis]
MDLRLRQQLKSMTEDLVCCEPSLCSHSCQSSPVPHITFSTFGMRVNTRFPLRRASRVPSATPQTSCLHSGSTQRRHRLPRKEQHLIKKKKL